MTASALWPREVWAKAVWKSDLTPTQRLVALCFADHARDRDTAWVSSERLQERTALARTASNGSVRALVGFGWLLPLTEPRQGHTPHYRLVLPVGEKVARRPSSVQAEGRVATPEGRVATREGRQTTPTELPTELPTSRDKLEEDATATTNTTATTEETGRALLAAVPASSLTAKAREHLTACLTAGWPPDALVHAVASPSWAGVAWPKAVLATRLQECAQQTPPTPAAARPRWCGDCHQGTRMAGEDAPRRCPACHPMALPTGAP